jgi:hypothetical protein
MRWVRILSVKLVKEGFKVEISAHNQHAVDEYLTNASENNLRMNPILWKIRMYLNEENKKMMFNSARQKLIVRRSSML